MDIKGICPIAPAVFDDHGNLDLTSYADCCRRLIALGAQALTLFGIAGEYYKLDADEERSLIDVTVRICHEEGVPAIVSNTRHATETACRWARHIEAAGADCMMLLPPFFLKPAGAALLSHLDAVCSAVSIPVMLQYAPEQTGVAIPPELLAELAARHDNLRYFKVECKPPAAYINRLMQLLPPGRDIFVGNAGFQMIEGFHRGCAGVMPGPSMPDVYRKVWDALLNGDYATAQHTHDKLNTLLNHIRQNVEMIIHFEKCILKRRGLIPSDYCRRPGFISEPVTDMLFEQYLQAIADEFAAEPLQPQD